MKRYIAIAAVAALVTTPKADASGIPTVDIANILQTSVSALENIEQVANQVEMIRNQIDQFNKLQEQLDRQVAQFDAITGTYNMGGLLNDQTYRALRRSLPTSWQETLAMLEAGAAAAHQQKMQDAAREAQAAGRRFAANDIYPDVTQPDALRYIRRANQVSIQMGIGISDFEATDRRLTNVEDLSDEIDTATDLKAAIDLQNRINAEQAVLTAELIRLQAASHIAIMQSQEDELNRRAADVDMADGTIAAFPDIFDPGE